MARKARLFAFPEIGDCLTANLRIGILKRNSIDAIEIEFDVVLGQLAELSYDCLPVLEWGAVPCGRQRVGLTRVQIRKPGEIRCWHRLVIVQQRFQELLKSIGHDRSL